MNLDNARQAFIEEVAELLQSMEDALLALEDNLQDAESLNEVFRAMHTIKGTAGVFGYNAVVEFTHTVETLMDQVRSGQRPLTNPLIATLVECRDHTERLVEFFSEASLEGDAAGGGALDEGLREAGDALLRRLGQPIAPTESVESRSTDRASGKFLPVSSDTWMITLEFGSDAFRNGMDPLSFLRYLGSLGDLVHVSTLLRMDPERPEAFDPESCYLCFGIAFRSDTDKATIAGVFEFAEQDCEIRILEPESEQAKYLDLLGAVHEDQVGTIGELLVHVGALTRRELERALMTQEAEAGLQSPGSEIRRRLGEILVAQGSIKPSVVEQAAKTQEAVRVRRQEESHFIRVDARRLGHLIDLVGELVTSSAAIRVIVNRAGIDDASEVVDGVDYLVSEIRDNALQLRMVPIEDCLSRFRRVVRDACQELGKQIDLVITGGETELDKTVIERMIDPLTHLIRNAIDHGIETPDVRQAAGKSPGGTLNINAFHDSGHIVIEIADDGAGLDSARIRAKAEARGLVKPEDSLSEEEVLRLIFAPGLSTKEQATNLSGRGVGMDVVRRNIEELRGSVELESELGVGTKITIILPLTLAIIEGFLVASGEDKFIIPLSQVVECVEMNIESTPGRHGNGQHYINLRGEVLPFIRLTELFESRENRSIEQRESLVVVRFGRHRMGLVVDGLLGELQTVIKPLGKLFERLHGVAGATILGTGEIALILDVTELAAVDQVGHPSTNAMLTTH
ncbi:CheA signal transduction histidine kinase [Thiorhodococcus drewsii AZ1]|uniref:Chemotaxis protein CheA n=1 Tax=Thiorhodococcus drewsii AZ1 TaxID=765913 RepID=G2E310_9GAMM|nr:chemotaxis protein CheA [Thiorhodococcus drewsii]EGV30472.1 CheA signal transduction histidine kinase [Thiorhodococcus drewsii AZ1]